MGGQAKQQGKKYEDKQILQEEQEKVLMLPSGSSLHRLPHPFRTETSD